MFKKKIKQNMKNVIYFQKFNINMKGIDIGHADADSSANYGMEEELTMPWQTTRDEEPVALQ